MLDFYVGPRDLSSNLHACQTVFPQAIPLAPLSAFAHLHVSGCGLTALRVALSALDSLSIHVRVDPLPHFPRHNGFSLYNGCLEVSSLGCGPCACQAVFRDWTDVSSNFLYTASRSSVLSGIWSAGLAVSSPVHLPEPFPPPPLSHLLSFRLSSFAQPYRPALLPPRAP